MNSSDNNDIVYFEVNNWFCGRDFPDCEPFLTWMRDDCNKFNNAEWVEQNKLCVIFQLVDMSFNYCVTATRS